MIVITLCQYVLCPSMCRELEAAAYGVDDCEESSAHSRDPLIADIYSDFTRCLHGFQQGVKVG